MMLTKAQKKQLRAKSAANLADMLIWIDNEPPHPDKQRCRNIIAETAQMLKKYEQADANGYEAKANQSTEAKFHFKIVDAGLSNIQTAKMREFYTGLLQELKLSHNDIRVVFFDPVKSAVDADFSVDQAKFSALKSPDDIADVGGWVDPPKTDIYVKAGLGYSETLHALAHEICHLKQWVTTGGASKLKIYRENIEAEADTYADNLLSRFHKYSRAMDRIRPGRFSAQF